MSRTVTSRALLSAATRADRKACSAAGAARSDGSTLNVAVFCGHGAGDSKTLHMTDWDKKAIAAPAINVVEDGSAFKVDAELAGMDPKNVEVEITSGYLTLKGERLLPLPLGAG